MTFELIFKEKDSAGTSLEELSLETPTTGAGTSEGLVPVPSNGGGPVLFFQDPDSATSTDFLYNDGTADDTTARVVVPDLFVREGEVFDVRHPAYGAKGDGTTDDSAAIQAAIDAAAAVTLTGKKGAKVLLPPGIYAIETTLTLGTGTATDKSTYQGIFIDGAGRSVLKWTGAAGGTMFRINGPYVDGGVRNLDFAGNSTAATCMDLVHASKCNFENINCYDHTGFGVVLASRASSTNPDFSGNFTDGANRNTFKNVHVAATVTDACGWKIGSALATDHIGCSQNVFTDCFFRADGNAGTNTIGFQLQFCDFNTFTGCLSAAVKPVVEAAPVDSLAFPGGNVFYNFSGSVLSGGTKTVVNDTSWAGTIPNVFLPLHLGDAETVPPYTDKSSAGFTTGNDAEATPSITKFGIWKNAPLLANLTDAAESKASWTTAEEFTKKQILPAGVLNVLGALIKVRAAGSIKALGNSPNVTFTIQVGLKRASTFTFLSTSAFVVTTDVTDATSWQIDMLGKTTTLGTSGVVKAIPGTHSCAAVSNLNQATGTRSSGTLLSATLDLTLDNYVVVKASCSASAATSVLTLDDLIVEIEYPKYSVVPA